MAQHAGARITRVNAGHLSMIADPEVVAPVTDLVEFADHGHSLTIDSGWREVAEACLAWLTKQGR